MKNEFISTIILIVIITVFVSLKKKGEKASSWKGELVKKRDIVDEDDENHVYKLIFKKDNGKKSKLSVSEKVFLEAKIGDRYEKIAGEFFPKKIS